MNIRDIVNRDIVNLTNCDQEPIHIPGSIQPHGFLLALDTSYVIVFCSGNVNQFVNVSHVQLLQTPLEVLLNMEQVLLIKDHVKKAAGQVASPLTVTIQDQQYQCSLHKSGELIVAEFEPASIGIPASAVYDQTVQFVRYMQESATLLELCGRIAKEVRKLTGYDRVMIYRFDNDYNGEVYAEDKREDLEPFLGLHYPHTDIPVQARQLYIRNLLRIIVDINYTAVPIYTLDDSPSKNIDLSLAVLRSTSPIHVQYLQNMGVAATLTISLIHEGKLWGLIACHHYTAKYIDHYTRINAQLQGHFLTSQINVRQTAEAYSVSLEVNNALEKILTKAILPVRQSLQEIVSDPLLLSICNSRGVAIVMDGVVYKSIKTPSDSDIVELANWAASYKLNRAFSTSQLRVEFPAGERMCETASGVIFCPLQSADNACIIWFNPETKESINWAGDPTKAIEKNANGLSPRRSFESWKVVTSCGAREWREFEITAAINFAHALQRHVTVILLKEEDIRQRQLTEQLKASNSELENINWISTHDLREPLRKIQIFSSRLLEREQHLPVNVKETIGRMSGFAGRMQKLIDSLSAYARTRQTERNFEEINLQKLVNDLLADVKEEIREKNASVTVIDMPSITGIPVLIQQLFLNLIRNSLKFSVPGKIPVIDICGYPHPVVYGRSGEFFYKVSVKDNGIGFEPAMGEVIFKVFSRLLPGAGYEGSGIGLALCKKVMQIHDGYIEAEGNLGAGAIFNLYFPVNNNTCA